MPLLENEKILVSKFENFENSKFPISKVSYFISKFQRFKISKYVFRSCKMCGTHTSHQCTVPKSQISQIICLENDLGFFLGYLECPGVSKDTHR